MACGRNRTTLVSCVKVLIDMNLSPMWVEFLGHHGIDSVHWTEIGRSNAPDVEIFAYAATNALVIFTHDLDFGTLLALQGTAAPSVIQVRMHDVMPAGECGSAVLQCIAEAEVWLLKGALVTVDMDRRRIRLLPIR